MNNDKFIADDAEKALVICMLYMQDDNGNTINFHETNYLKIANEIEVDDFRIEQIRIIYARIKKLLAENKSIDFITVANNDPDMMEYLVNLTNTHFMCRYQSSISEYIKIVKEKSALRKIYTNLMLLKKHIDSCDEIEDIENLKFKCQESFNIQITPKTERKLDNIMDDFISELKDKSEQKEIVKKNLYGFQFLDYMTCGTDKGEVTILAARPSIGKTAFAIQIMKNKAYSGGNCVMFNLEMRDVQLVMRLVSQTTMIDSNILKLGRLSEDDWTAIYESKNEMKDLDITVIDDLFTIEAIVNKCKELNLKKQLDYIVIDYLQLIDSPQRKFNSNNDKVEYISRQIKMLNKILKCPILLLSQLNRGPEGRECKRPTMSDLRSSGAIEQDADNIFYLWRPTPEIEGEKTKDVRLYIDKQRNGKRDVELNMIFNAEYFMFEESENKSNNVAEYSNIIDFSKKNKSTVEKEVEINQTTFSEVPF